MNCLLVLLATGILVRATVVSPEPNNCACHHTDDDKYAARVGGDPGRGNCFACGSCHS